MVNNSSKTGIAEYFCVPALEEAHAGDAGDHSCASLTLLLPSLADIWALT